jgi:DNA-binding NarL/FixJ family response regulator
MPSSSAERYETLTSRERDVFHLAAEGHTNPEISQRLFIGVRTVEGYRANLMRKLGLRNQTDLVRYALQGGPLSIKTQTPPDERRLKRSQESTAAIRARTRPVSP